MERIGKMKLNGQAESEREKFLAADEARMARFLPTAGFKERTGNSCGFSA